MEKTTKTLTFLGIVEELLYESMLSVVSGSSEKTLEATIGATIL